MRGGASGRAEKGNADDYALKKTAFSDGPSAATLATLSAEEDDDVPKDVPR